MKKKCLCVCLCVFSIAAFAQTKDLLKVQKFVLDNGLTVLLNEDHSEPKVMGSVVVKVGSKIYKGNISEPSTMQSPNRIEYRRGEWKR